MADSDDPTAGKSIESWLASLAQTGANPGGGAAAALMAGMAAALAEMVAAYRSADDPSDAERGARAQRAFAAAFREAAPAMADDDTAASAGFAEAARAPGGEKERAEARKAASVGAAESSVALGRFAAGLLPVLRELAADAGTLLLADVGVAAATLAASARTAALNICADLRLAKEAASGRQDLLDVLEQLDATVRELDQIVEQVRDRLDPRSLKDSAP